MSYEYRHITVSMAGTVSAEGLHEWRDGTPCRTSLQSYDRLPRFLAQHGHECAAGAPVVDLSDLEGRVTVSEVFRMPMVDVRLSDADRIDRWQGAGLDEVDSFAATIAGSYFGAAGIAAATSTTEDEPGPFDHVSPWHCAELWRAKGARVGWIEREHDGRTIVRWTGGAVTVPAADVEKVQR